MAIEDDLSAAGVPYPLAVEMLAGIRSGSTTPERLVAVGLPAPASRELAAQINARTGVAHTLTTSGFPPIASSLIRTLINTGAWLPTPGAVLDIDLVAGRALAAGQQYASLASYLASPGLSFSRASKKTAQKKDGTLVSFDNDVPARTDKGLLLEPAATNFVPFNSDLTGSGWGGTVGGTAPATNAVPTNAAAPVSYPSPDGTGAEAGKGVTNSGLVWDAARGRFLVGNDGGRNENVTGVARQTSIVAVDQNFTKIGEWPLIWPGDTVNDQGIQGIGIDTKRDLVIAVVPSRQYIAFFNPTTMAVVKTLPLPSGFLPNGLAYDSLRDEYWVTDNATLFIHRIGQDGRIVATYKPGAIETPGLDQLCYLPASDELLFTAGANNTSGYVFSLDCSKLRVKRAMTCVEAKAIEGVAVVGSDVFVCSDGYFHNASAPYNVNVILKYPASSLVAFGYQRLWADFADFNGLGVKADRLIMDKGAGTTASDLRSFFITAAASGSTATKTMSVWMRSADGETYTVYIRGDTTIANVVVGPTWQRYSITGSMISAPSIQVGLRKGNAPYNTSDFADIVIAGFQCELGSVATSLIENATASAVTRAADSGTLAVVAGPKDLVATFDDGTTQTIPTVNGNYPMPVNLNRPTLARLVAMTS